MDIDAKPGETEAVVERQEIPNEEAAVHSMMAWQKETVSCQVTTEAWLDNEEPTSEDTKRRKDEMRPWKCPGCKNGMRSRNVKEPLHLRKVANGIRGRSRRHSYN
jgi:hypothetical protein